MSLFELDDYLFWWLKGVQSDGLPRVDPIIGSVAGARGFRDGEQAFRAAEASERARLGLFLRPAAPVASGQAPSSSSDASHESSTLGAVRKGTLAALGIQTGPSAGSGVAGPFPRENLPLTPFAELIQAAPAPTPGAAVMPAGPWDHKQTIQDGDGLIDAPPRKRWLGAGGYNPAAVACQWVKDVTEGRNPITLNVSAETYDHARSLLRRALEELPLLAPGEASREHAHDVHTLRAIVVSTLAALGAQPETAASELPRVAATVQHFATAKSRVAWGVAHNAGMRSHERRVRWAHVADVTGLGSTSAKQLCRDQGVDPDEEIGGE